VNVAELAMIQNGSPARKRLNHESAGENDAAMLNQKRDALDGSRTVGKQEVIQFLPVCPSHDQNRAVVRACASSSFTVVFPEYDDALI
jgi:hypothetical protein